MGGVVKSFTNAVTNPFSSKNLGMLYDPIGKGGLGHQISNAWHKSGISDTLGGVFGGMIPKQNVNIPDAQASAASGDSQVAASADVQTAGQAQAGAAEEVRKRKGGSSSSYGATLSI